MVRLIVGGWNFQGCAKGANAFLHQDLFSVKVADVNGYLLNQMI